MHHTQSSIVVALDFPTQDAALEIARQLDPTRCRVKVGKELFTREGPAVVRALHALGFEVFLDLKFHDIPNTVARALDAAADLGVWMVNVHATGGRTMLEAAAERLAKRGTSRPLLIGVTLLTSLHDADLPELGWAPDAGRQVVRLAALVADCGLDGVVCSARDLTNLQARVGGRLLYVTPGIRPSDAPPDDQARTATPAEAWAAGAHHLVIGRPITKAADPAAAVEGVLRTLR